MGNQGLETFTLRMQPDLSIINYKKLFPKTIYFFGAYSHCNAKPAE